MQLVHLHALLGLILGAVTICATVFSFHYLQYSVLILGGQAALLATIYSVGNIYVEHKIKEEYEEIIEHIEYKLQV